MAEDIIYVCILFLSGLSTFFLVELATQKLIGSMFLLDWYLPKNRIWSCAFVRTYRHEKNPVMSHPTSPFK